MYNEYSTELCHHGILGQRWGVRRFQNKDGSVTAAGAKRYQTGEAKSVKAGAHRALAKVYGINENFYSKHTKNKTLASMNKAAKNEQLKKAAAAQKEANDKKEAKLDAYRTKLADKNLRKAKNASENAKEAQAQVDDLKAKGVRSETYKKMFENDPDHRAYTLKYNPETGKRELDYDSKKVANRFANSLFPASKMKQYMDSANEDVEIYSYKAKQYMNKHKDLMNIKIDSSMSKSDIRKASKQTNNAEAAKERRRQAQELNTLIYGSEGNKKK